MPQPLHYEGAFTGFMNKKREAEALHGPAKWEEFPKAVKRRDGSEVVVLTHAAELALVAEDWSEKPAGHPAEARVDELALALGNAQQQADDARFLAAAKEVENSKLQVQMAELEARLARLEPASAPVPAPVTSASPVEPAPAEEPPLLVALAKAAAVPKPAR